MAYSTKHAINEASYSVGRTSRYVGGFAARMALRGLTALGAIIAGVSGPGVWYATGLLGLGSGIGLQAYLNHKDYEHEIEQLASIYEKEISAYTGKNRNEVGLDDLKLVAEQVPALQEHLDKQKTSRNVKTGIWIAAAAVGFIGAASLFTLLPAVTGFVAASAGVKVLAGLGGLAIFSLSRPIVEKVANKSFNLNEPTAIDIIKSLEWTRTKNQKISQAQVMEVYLASMPQLSENIQQNFGKSFAQLDVVQQQHIIMQYGPHVMLNEVTQAINDNRLNARELAFTVSGQRSGAYADTSYSVQFKEGLSTVREKAKDIHQNVTQAGQNAMNTVRNFVSKKEVDEALITEALAPDDADTKWRDSVKKSRDVNLQEPNQTAQATR